MRTGVCEKLGPHEGIRTECTDGTHEGISAQSQKQANAEGVK
jgi:hypothetical protein